MLNPEQHTLRTHRDQSSYFRATSGLLSILCRAEQSQATVVCYKLPCSEATCVPGSTTGHPGRREVTALPCSQAPHRSLTEQPPLETNPRQPAMLIPPPSGSQLMDFCWDAYPQDGATAQACFGVQQAPQKGAMPKTACDVCRRQSMLNKCTPPG